MRGHDPITQLCGDAYFSGAPAEVTSLPPRAPGFGGGTLGSSEVELVPVGELRRAGGLVYNPDAQKVKAAQLKLVN